MDCAIDGLDHCYEWARGVCSDQSEDSVTQVQPLVRLYCIQGAFVHHVLDWIVLYLRGDLLCIHLRQSAVYLFLLVDDSN